MKLTTECLECLLRRNLKTARSLGDEDQAMRFARGLMDAIVHAPAEAASPYFGPCTADLFHEIYGLDPDRFRAEKEASNRFVLERMDAIRARVEGADDPVYAGLQCAILGNYIDFSALQDQVDFAVLDGLLEKSMELPLDGENYAALCADLRRGGELLYLTDNAGEIGFDRILAEQIVKSYPQVRITFCVRGGPAMNDATREDAAAMGITFPVIDNGSRIAGTDLTAIGAEARAAIENAALILAKGQGNAETMLGCGKNVYYAFLVKCRRFVEDFGVPAMTPMLVRESTCPVK